MTANDRMWIVLRALEANAVAYGFGNVPSVVMLAQSAHETGGWTSNLCVEHNNAFGMMLPQQRETTAIGGVPNDAHGGAQFAVYASLEDSAIDYLMRQRAFHIANTQDVEEYVADTVSSGYAEDPDYAGKWLAWIIKLNDGGVGEAPPPGDEASEKAVGIGALLFLAWLATSH